MSSIMTWFGGSDFLPQKTCVAQRACNSDIGKIAPRGWMQPKTASVWLARCGGNTYLYNSTWLSATEITEESINLKPILYPVQKITASKSFTSEPSSKTTPVSVKRLILGLTTTLPTMMRWGSSSLTIGCWPRIGCSGRKPNVSWSNLRFTACKKRRARSLLGNRAANRLPALMSIGTPPLARRDSTHAPLRVLRWTRGVWRLSSTAMSPPEFPIPVHFKR